MPIKSSLALITGAVAFIAFWGIGLASIDSGSAGAAVTDDGYGIYVSRTVESNNS